MNSRPWEDRMEILRSSGAEVVGPHIDYTTKDGWDEAVKLIEGEKGFTHVVGHSFGGIICSYITDVYSIPSLMFNPAYHPINNEYFDRRMPPKNKWSKGGKVYYAVVGMKDEVVNPFGQMTALKRKGGEPLVKIFQEPELGHKVDPTTFKKYFDIFYADTK
jgi:hypothetical protein